MLRRFLAGAWVAIAVIELATIADAATGRRASRAIERELRAAHDWLLHERELRRASRWVVFEAIEATREGEHSE